MAVELNRIPRIAVGIFLPEFVFAFITSVLMNVGRGGPSISGAVNLGVGVLS